MMKIVKVTALGCPSCIVMQNIWNEVTREYIVETLELDNIEDRELIFSEYDYKNRIPLFIYYKDGVEVARITGECSKEEFIKPLEDNGCEKLL